jgi:hypothetical protein
MLSQQDATQLEQFIEASKSKGASDEFLAAFLIRRGWAATDVYDAIGNHWERVTGLAVPAHSGSGESARDAFLYLLSFSTLATWATALGSMAIQLINYWIPDAVTPGSVYNLRSSLSWQMASVAIAFPVYLLVMRTIFGEAARQPQRLMSGVRRWLTYLALWITAAIMVGDLICFLNYFLEGEITARFVLKAAVVMLIAGAVFTYYLSSLRWNSETVVSKEKSRNVAFGAGALLAVAVTFCMGLGVAGTPSRQRSLEADQKRVQDLRQLAWAVQAWQKRNRALPAQLSDLRTGTAAARFNDPESGKPYGYRCLSDTRYEVCAEFAAADPVESSAYYATRSPFWNHGKGRTCFALDASEAVPW